jgi:hypothetical protein
MTLMEIYMGLCGFLINILNNKGRIMGKILDEAAQLDLINKDWLNLQFIKNPTQRVCLIAVSKNWMAIRDVENQTEEMGLIAVSQYYKAISSIKNPTKEMYSIALSQTSKDHEYRKKLIEKMSLL